MTDRGACALPTVSHTFLANFCPLINTHIRIEEAWEARTQRGRILAKIREVGVVGPVGGIGMMVVGELISRLVDEYFFSLMHTVFL